MCPKREDDMVLIEIKKKKRNNLSLPNAKEFRDIKRSNVSL